jgi:hypothetical protein
MPRRRIEPTLINNNNHHQQQNGINGISHNLVAGGNNMFPVALQINPEMLCLSDNRPKKRKEYTLETKLICHKIEQFENNVYLFWENKKYDNLCNISLQIDNGTLYSNRYDNRQIRLLTCNSFLYAFYDTQNHISIFTLFNNLVMIHTYK